jgi:hypothetical protein
VHSPDANAFASCCAERAGRKARFGAVGMDGPALVDPCGVSEIRVQSDASPRAVARRWATAPISALPVDLPVDAHASTLPVLTTTRGALPFRGEFTAISRAKRRNVRAAERRPTNAATPADEASHGFVPAVQERPRPETEVDVSRPPEQATFSQCLTRAGDPQSQRSRYLTSANREPALRTRTLFA